MRSKDRGASAVEFALVAPLLIALLLGIIAFGHAFHVQSVLSNAARDAVRVMTLQDGSDGIDPRTEAREQAIASAGPSVDLTAPSVDIKITPDTCRSSGAAAPETATVVITYPMKLLGGIGNIALTGKGTMRCNG